MKTIWFGDASVLAAVVAAPAISGVAGIGEIVYQMPRWFGGTVTVNF